MSTPEYLARSDLNRVAGTTVVDQLFDEDGDGTADTAHLNEHMAQAEAYAASYLLRAYAAADILTIAAGDPFFKSQVAWVAIELGCEGKPGFLAADGKGRYWAQFERATEYFDRLAKAARVTKGIGNSANGTTGGEYRPKLLGQPIPRVFGNDEDAPQGRGGF